MILDDETDNSTQTEVMASVLLMQLKGFKGRKSTDTLLHEMRGVLRAYLWSLPFEPDRWLFHIMRTQHDTAIDLYVVRNYVRYPMTAKEFGQHFERSPQDDDLHRVNCGQAGAVGHFMCGWCMVHRTARFGCGCVARMAR